MRKPIAIIFSTVLITGMTWSSCTHDAGTDPTDAQLLQLARMTAAYTWYKENAALLPRSSGSGHPQPFLRTRFNPIAGTVLDTAGKVVPDTLFPNGSVIVKELWEDASTLSIYAILYKKPDNPNADANGWVWAEIGADGTAHYSATKGGADCRGCHGQAGNIDFTLMNEAFP